MGFSTIAAGTILFVGALFLAATVVNATFETQRTGERAKEERLDREVLARETQIRLDSTNFQGNRLHIYVTNTGSSVLDLDKVHVIVDGVWRNDAISQTHVDNDPNTDLWMPGEQLYLRVDVSPKPSRAWVVTETGQGVVGEP